MGNQYRMVLIYSGRLALYLVTCSIPRKDEIKILSSTTNMKEGKGIFPGSEVSDFNRIELGRRNSIPKKRVGGL